MIPPVSWTERERERENLRCKMISLQKDLYNDTTRFVEVYELEMVIGMQNEILIGIKKLLFYVSFQIFK